MCSHWLSLIQIKIQILFWSKRIDTVLIKIWTDIWIRTSTSVSTYFNCFHNTSNWIGNNIWILIGFGQWDISVNLSMTWCLITANIWSMGKVMFSHASIIPSTGGGLHSYNTMGRQPPQRGDPSEDRTPQTTDPHQKADLPIRQTPIRRQTPQDTDTATVHAQQAGGTYPTGMHPCSHICFHSRSIFHVSMKEKRVVIKNE